MKDSCEKKYFQETILELCSRDINLGKSSGIKKNKRQTNYAISMYNTDTTIKVKQFTQEICNMLLKDLNKWVNELQAAPEAGKPVVIKYGS